MPEMKIASGFCWSAVRMPPAGFAALKTMLLNSQPIAAAAALPPVAIFAQIGSSHCSQKIVLPVGGAFVQGSVIAILSGGDVTGSGTDAAALCALVDAEP